MDKLGAKILLRMIFRAREAMRKGRRLDCGGRVMRCKLQYIGTAQYQPASPVLGGLTLGQQS